MKIGFFTDTYFPQVSGVATSIKTLKTELEKKGHQVFIFTTTDPNVTEIEEGIIRMPSVPFISFKDRRIVVRGMWYAYRIAQELELDLIHTHTEFGAGLLGKMVGKKMKIPVIHTYHTMYEDYLHYIAKGKVIRQSHVKFFSRLFANHTTGVVCPSERVIDTLREYGVTSPMRIIPTGIEIEKFDRPDITDEQKTTLRAALGLTSDEIMVLSLSRVSYEKNIQAVIAGFPEVLVKLPQARLVIVGKGPHLTALQQQAEDLGISEFVSFTGEVPNDEVALYYHAADIFVSASTSETQGLTYIEAMASGTQLVVEGNDYLNNLIDDPSFGITFATDDDFAPALVGYLQDQPQIVAELLEQKMYEISATHFGEVMLDFYHDMLAYYEDFDYDRKIKPVIPKPAMKKIKVKLGSSLKKISNQSK